MTTDAPGQLTSVNPHDGTTLESYTEHSDAQVGVIMDKVLDAQRSWARSTLAERSAVLERIADGLRTNFSRLAVTITQEMGKPIGEAEAEVKKCAWVCDYYATHASQFLATQEAPTDAKRARVYFRPLGVVLAIMPWNFPFWQTFRFAAPAIAAGNGVLLKHASNVTGCALALESLFADCAPENLMRALLVSSGRMRGIIEDSRVSAVTFTGSTTAGSKVGAAAGGAIKKSVLELGGSDPYLVLEDADIEHAAEVCAAARLVNSGQSCIAAKRFIVAHGVYDTFLEALCSRMLSVPMGDPMDRDNRIGPLARVDLADHLARQVERSVDADARMITDPQPGRAGGDAYFVPAVLADVRPGMPAADEELFGPVAAVMRARDEGDMIRLANASTFGLGGAVFSADEARAERIAAQSLSTGSVAVNGQVVSDPRLPFGGVKRSGYGRELGEFGIREFVNVKSVVTFDGA
jgi:succinate-semialdehyde dehydrogenase/glutarate-semialdehyde dehydrogenase